MLKFKVAKLDLDLVTEQTATIHAVCSRDYSLSPPANWVGLV